MWKGILYTVIVFAVIFLIAKLFFWMLPFILIAAAGIYVYNKFKVFKQEKIEKKVEETKVINDDTYKFTSKEFTAENKEVIDVEYKEINK